MKAYLFPGQGSQKKGMGEGLFEQFADLTKLADEILGYSIRDLCLNDPEKTLGQTQYTQPALYVVNAFHYQRKLQDEGTPGFLAGHSLGEYNALQAAGVFSFKNGLKLVKKRGELMGKANGGAMAAVIKSSEKRIREILQEEGLTGIDIANLNAPSQTVISGLKEDIEKARPFFEKDNTMFVPLNTSGAFHSRYMEDAREEFEKYVKKFKFSDPEIPVIANVTARQYGPGEIAQNMVRQISNCVRWTESIGYLIEEGVTEFVEIGESDVLTKLVGYIKKDVASKRAESAKKSNIKETAAIPTKELVETRREGAAVNDTSVEKYGASWYETSKDARELVEKWNSAFPIGTKVSSELYSGEELETRTEAVLLFGHRAAVYMKGYKGYFDLREIEPLTSNAV
ncbi:MAG: ACP S-malonyltransferase [Chitinivibrionales bacterium]|nr:ACP S-malonyltransferase [Chitinivibrionales bacterium]